MELDSFITNTITSIIKGVKDSQSYAKDNNALVNPIISGDDLNSPSRKNTTISFDIAVTASSEKQSGLNGGINVMSMNIGGKVSDKEAENYVSRIKFDIPVCLPYDKIF